MKRRHLLLSGIGSLLVSGAITAGLVVPATVSAQDQSVFTFASPAGFPDLDPATSFSNDGAVMANAYETLTRYIPALDGGEATVEPVLATQWSASEDGLTWTFKLREGVKFADGEALTASAVKASIDRTIAIGGGAAFIWWPLDSIDTPDDLTVVMNLNTPQPMDVIAAAGFAAWIISPTVADKDNAYFNAGKSAGTGPYNIERYDPGQRVIMGRNENYWGGFEEGQFDKLVFEVVEDAVLMQNMIESGKADLTYNLPYENLDSLGARDEINIVTNSSFQTLFGLYNVKKPHLDDSRVRTALSMAFPYDDVITAGTNGLGQRAMGVIPRGIWGHDADAPVPSLDLEAAAAMLKEAGVSDLELTMTYGVGDTLQSLAGELWKANLATMGVTLNLQPMAWEAQWELGKSDPAAAQDIFVMYWWPTFITPYDYLFNLFHSEESPNFNLGYYANADFDNKINDANELSGTDRAGSVAGFIEGQRMIIEDAAAVFMLDLPNVHAVRSNIKGYVDNPAYGHVPFAHQMSR